MYRNISLLLAGLLTGGMTLGCSGAMAAADPFANPNPHPQASTHIVLQITQKTPQTEKIVLHNVANILKFYGPQKVETEVVAYGPGIDLLLKKNKNNAEVEKLSKQGVMFAACENTMHAMHINKAQLNKSATPVPSGAVAIVKREQQGWQYLRP
jgi:intracellular sulfur oxidation DsrE/DsrF family protein